MQTYPLTQDLVLIGGGHAHALVLLNWAMNPLPGVRLTLIDPNPTAPYTGMLPGHIAGHYARAELEMDLVALARHAGARLILGRATALDPVAQTVTVPGRPPVAYDVASLDIGITSDLPGLAGFADHAIAAKPLGGYSERWASFVAQVEAGTTSPDIVILGAGVAGVELALAMDHRLRHLPARRITLIERARALPHLGRLARNRLLALLDLRKIAPGPPPGATVLSRRPAAGSSSFARVAASAAWRTLAKGRPARSAMSSRECSPSDWLSTQSSASWSKSCRAPPIAA